MTSVGQICKAWSWQIAVTTKADISPIKSSLLQRHCYCLLQLIELDLLFLTQLPWPSHCQQAASLPTCLPAQQTSLP